MKRLKYYPRDYSQKLSANITYPCYSLAHISWDDHGFRTKYMLYFHPNEYKKIEIGIVKILDSKNKHAVFQKNFKRLSAARYCSLGQTISYYKNLRLYKDEIYSESILDSLNDISYNSGQKDRFSQIDGFEESLIRESSAVEALETGRRVYEGEKSKQNFSFTFDVMLKGADKSHKVDFDFKTNELLPYRIFSLVGKNGTGKTQYLAKLSQAFTTRYRSKNIRFHDEKIKRKDTPFKKIIAISFSIFDKFKIPKSNKSIAYSYFGVRNRNGKFDENLIRRNYNSTTQRLGKKSLGVKWYYFVKDIIDPENTDIIEKYVENLDDSDFLKGVSNPVLSSGQKLILHIIADVFGSIEENTLVLFDEPETHLHPNALSHLIRTLYRILDEFDSFCIMATHSPIVLQEIPSKYISVFEKNGNIPVISKPHLETYGENLTEITQSIFQTIDVEENYKNVLEKLAKNFTYNEILNIFDNNLSLNAKILLRSLKNRYP